MPGCDYNTVNRINSGLWPWLSPFCELFPTNDTRIIGVGRFCMYRVVKERRDVFARALGVVDLSRQHMLEIPLVACCCAGAVSLRILHGLVAILYPAMALRKDLA